MNGGGSSPSPAGVVERAAAWLTSHRLIALVAVLLLSGLLGNFARHVRPDYRVELLFPVWNAARPVYDRFKASFPHEDSRALVIAQGDVLSREGIARLAALEQELRAVRGVEQVNGPASAQTIVLAGDRLALEPVLPGQEASDARWEAGRRMLTTDPLFVGNVATPDGKAVTLEVRLDAEAGGTDEGRQRSTDELRSVLARHQRPALQLTLSGVPPIRATFATMIARDAMRLVPLALLIALLLVLVAFRSAWVLLATFATLLAGLLWSYGVLGALGYPLSMMTSILPVIVIIISLSDSVHLAADFLANRRAGLFGPAAVARMLEHSAVPCLLTEVVIACGFLSLVFVNIAAISQFGLAAALSMLLVWVANVTVLPLILSLAGPPESSEAQARPPPGHRWFVPAAGWIARQVTERPNRVLLIAFLLVAASAALGTRVSTVSYAFDDLRAGSPFEQEIRLAERVQGGLLPISIFIEAEGPERDAAVDPVLLGIADRGAGFLRTFPELQQATSLADFVRHAQQALGEPSNTLPDSRAALRRGLARLPDRRLVQDVLSADGRALVAVGRMPDVGSKRIKVLFDALEEWVVKEQAALDALPDGPKARIHATGQVRMFREIDEALMAGLLGSLGASIAVSFLVMLVVLRSWKLAVIGLVPNLAPVVMVLGFMALVGVALKPVTVVVFSITLVIAEDDTIQLLSRLRGHYRRALERGAPDPHLEGAVSCMREVALPIFITSTAVSAGFLLLLLSQFLGPAYIGMLIGVTLFAAVFADLFVTPILVAKLKPFAIPPGGPRVPLRNLAGD